MFHYRENTPTAPEIIQSYWDLHTETRDESGVLLTLPEHVLSFRLSGIQALLDEKQESASAMVGMQSWLDRVSRDVIDERNFTLAVKTQLICPSGSQCALDGHPS